MHCCCCCFYLLRGGLSCLAIFPEPEWVSTGGICKRQVLSDEFLAVDLVNQPPVSHCLSADHFVQSEQNHVVYFVIPVKIM